MSQRGSEDRSSKNLDQIISSDNSLPPDTQTLLSFTPVPTTRTSLPIRGANPGDPFSGREVAEISVDHLLIRESDLNLNTEDLLLNVTRELKEVDKSIIEFNKKTPTNMDENAGPSGSSNQLSNTQQPKTKEPVQQVDWTADNNSHHIFPGTEGMNKQSMGQIVNDGTHNGSMESKKENSVHTEHLKEFDLDALINQRMKELCQNYSVKAENADQEKTSLESIREIIDAKIIAALGKKGYTGTPQPEPSMANYIGLKEALNLLPKSCDGRDIEQLDIFLENCEFAVSCVQEPSKNRLLQAIMTRLTGKARQVSRNRTFDTWEALREFLKANLEPQRTTQHLYLELYSSKQKKDEDVLTYSMRIEELQTLLIEQETAELTAEAARAMETSIKRQTKQVFMEDLGVFKDFIKARNPHTLEMAIQAAREEEKIKTSSVETKKLYQPTKRGTESYTSAKKPNGPCHVCKKLGHWARDCRYKNTGNSSYQSDTTASKNKPNTINVVNCQYCKKPGHTKEECRKLKYVTGKRNEENKSGNQPQLGSSGSRPAGSLKTAAITFSQSS